MGFGSIALVVPVMVAAVRLVRDHPDEYADAPFRVRPRLLVGVAGAAVVLNVALLGLLASQFPAVFATWVGLLVVGGVYYVVRARYLAADGVDMEGRMTRALGRDDEVVVERSVADGRE